MKKTTTILAAIFLLLATPLSLKAERLTENFDSGWQFVLSDASIKDIARIKEWRTLDLPHDWSIEGSYNKYHSSGRGGGYLPTDIGWYRKTLILPESFNGKRIFIEFDGIMACSEVYVNGHLLGTRPNGYVPLCYELTDYLKADGTDEIAVKADNSTQPASRWYSGCGIYRHVRLVAKDPVYMPAWSPYVKTVKVSEKKAEFLLSTEIKNSSDKAVLTVLEYFLKDRFGNVLKKGASTAKVLAPGETSAFSVPMQYEKPHLWSVDDPYLYLVSFRVLVKNELVDRETVSCGMRDIRFDANTGFWLNGHNIKMYGVCIHSEAGAMGSAVPSSVWRYRLRTLKELGVNAIRLSHNPVSPEFLNLCDEMGFLVMNETFDTWTAPKNHAEKAYNLYFKDWWEVDTRDIVMHDRNHPSIVIWSVGNEIRDNLNNEEGFAKYRNQQDLIHSLDGTRPVTMALFRPVSSGVYSNGFAEMMDVVGQNYRIKEMTDYHAAHPEKVMIGTENTHDIETWLLLRDSPWLCGQFLWTGIDYLGEADWPKIGLGAGLIDITGKVKERGLQRKSWWSKEAMVAMTVKEQNSQTQRPQPGRPMMKPEKSIAITVYSNCSEVELFVDGKSLGKQAVPSDAKPVTYSFKGNAREYKVLGYNDGVEAASCIEVTPFAPYCVSLDVEEYGTGKFNFDDVIIVRASVVDSLGILCNNDDHTIEFRVEGGTLLGTDNADLTDHSSYRSPVRNAYEGSCIAYIRRNPGETLSVTASSVGIPYSMETDCQVLY